MKRKGLILVLIALFALVLFNGSNKDVDAAEGPATITFDNVSKRTVFTTSQQVWEENGIVVTNDKASSTNDVGDYSKPARFYKNSIIKVEYLYGKITKIEFNSATGDYKTYLESSLSAYNPTVSENKYTVELDGTSNEFSFVASGGQVRFNSLTVTYIAEDRNEYTGEAGTALYEEFNYYYNNGQYVKDTFINVDINKVGDELADLVHAYDPVNKIDVDKTTTYCGDYLYFDSETKHGYGTNGDYLTSGNFNGSKFVATTTHTNLPGMETYYLTLKDFVLGTHTSAHTDNEKLNLTQGWTKEGGVYTTENADVIAAFALFTAPTWLKLEADNYLRYTKATVEINEDGNLVMKLWVSLTDKEGKLIDAAEYDETNAVFSYATIYDSNIAKADEAASKVAKLGCDVFGDYKLPTTLEGYEGLTIAWSGKGVSNNVLTYLEPAEDTPVYLTATVTYKHQTRVVENIEFTHKVAVEVNPSEVVELAIFNLGANGSASHADGTSKTTYSETVNGISLQISSGSSFYTGARDAKGNSCCKLGTSSKTGSFKITVPNNVTEVVIYVAKYKSNTTKITVNGGTAQTLTKNSNDGAYDVITIDTTTTKTITFSTATGGIRAMVNTIVFNGYAQ